MINHTKVTHAALSVASTSIAAVVLLSACGGGGGGGTGTGAGGSSVADINGTGYTAGNVQQFGSVIIDDVSHDSSTATIAINGQPGSEIQLQIGQRLRLLSEFSDDGSAIASEVVYQADLVGNVQTIQRSQNRFTVADQTVLIDGNTLFNDIRFARLEKGQRVEVSGTSNANGELLASYVGLLPPASDGAVTRRGIVANADTANQRFELGNISVNYSGAVRRPAAFLPADGDRVIASGQLNNGVLVATEVREDPIETGTPGDSVTLSGIVQRRLGPARIVVADRTIRHGSHTVYTNGSEADLTPNQPIKLRGRINDDGELIANRVRIITTVKQRQAIRVEAPLEEANNQRLLLLGIEVQLDGQTVFKDRRDDSRPAFGVDQLAAGDFIEIRGHLDDGTLIAGRVERVTDEQRVLLQARLQQADEANAEFVMRGVTVETSSARFENMQDEPITSTEFFAGANTGQLIKAKGPFRQGRIAADVVSFEAEADETDDDDNDQPDID